MPYVVFADRRATSTPVSDMVALRSKLLKIHGFNLQKILDTPLAPLIRFRQKKFLTVRILRWNYSPLKKRPPELPGGLFVCQERSTFG